MSGASSNAAARRRRATQPQNVNRLRNQSQLQSINPNQFNTSITNQFQQNQQFPTQSINYNNTSSSSNDFSTVTIDGLPALNGKVMHPVEILKNLHKRVIDLENSQNKSTNSNNELDKHTSLLLTTKIQELEKTKNDLNIKINNSMNDLKSFETAIREKSTTIENTVSKLEDKINEIKELCSKIQTFSMETNMSFMIFKNQFENQYNNNDESMQLFKFINEQNINDCNSTVNNYEEDDQEEQEYEENEDLNNKIELNVEDIEINNEDHDLNIQEILSMSNTENVIEE